MEKIVIVKNILRNLAKIEMELNDGLMALRRYDSFRKAMHDNEPAFAPMFEVMQVFLDASLSIPSTVCGTTPIYDAKPFVLDFYKRAYKGLTTFANSLQTLADMPSLADVREALLEQIEITNNYKAEMAETWELD